MMNLLFLMLLLTVVEGKSSLWKGRNSVSLYKETPAMKVRSRLECVVQCSTGLWNLTVVEELSYSTTLCRCMNSTWRTQDIRGNFKTFRRIGMKNMSELNGNRNRTPRPGDPQTRLGLKKSNIRQKEECPNMDPLVPPTSDNHLFQLHMESESSYLLLLLLPSSRRFKKVETTVPGTHCKHIAIIGNTIYFCESPNEISFKCMGKEKWFMAVLKEKKKIIDLYADPGRKILIYLTKVKSSVQVRLFILKNKRKHHVSLGRSFQQMALDVKQGKIYWLQNGDNKIHTMPYIWHKRFVKSVVVNATFRSIIHFEVCPALDLIVWCQRNGLFTGLHSFHRPSSSIQETRLPYGAKCRDIVCFQDHIYVDHEISLLKFDQNLVKTNKMIKTADLKTSCRYCGAFVKD